MSSTPMTPGSPATSAAKASSSPPSSPPSAAEDKEPEESEEAKDQDEDDASYDPAFEKAEAEEKRLQEQTRREEAKRRAKDKSLIEHDGSKDKSQSLKDLDWFLERSQGFSGSVMGQLEQALEARKVGMSAQPKLVSGGKMRDYQLEGLTWLTCLYQIGLNGILADEMGLGKTIQLISFLAFLRENGTNGPFLILGPLSTVSNWVNEFAYWTPKIPVVMYHGNPQVRAGLRRKELKGDSKGEKFPVVCTSYEICMRDKKFLASYPWKFIVVVSTTLQHWRDSLLMTIQDEGHRLKNFNCKLVQELKQYPSESRLILTGTPLQNNLAELWSLLNFLLPEAFSDLEHFESMFDFSDVQTNDHKQFMSKERQKRTVASLHAILKPFLLRRVKNDVETNLPKKREYILYAPLTPSQKEIYRKIKDNDIRSYLEEQAMRRIGDKLKDTRVSSVKGTKRKAASGASTPNKSAKSSRGSTPASSGIRSGRSRRRQDYAEVSDREYFKRLEEGSESESTDEESRVEKNRADLITQVRKEVNHKKLQNPIMQLRLACNSPHHFFWPFAPDADPDETLVTASGKMLMLDRLVPYLFKAGHKVLIFSQFSTQLNILEEWAGTLRGWPVCRVDGGVKQEDRAEQIDAFNNQKSHKLFLLSTRAGGLGINLTSADTVILFDSDWNPQQDLQAQDRAHRIGQTRPVIVYRLATKGTIEQTLLEKADGKRRLEKLVIQKDKFRGIVDSKRGSKSKKGEADEDYDELQQILAEDDFENYDPGEGTNILSEADLKLLTDRSAAAYEKAATGEGSGDKFKTIETKGGNSDILQGMGG